MEKLNILVVEDDKLAQKVMAQHLAGHEVEFAGDLAAALAKLGARRYDLCFIDLQLGADDAWSGLKVIPLAVEKGIYSVVMSGCDSDDMVEKAYQLGCNDFYAKGNESANVSAVIGKYLQKKAGFAAESIFVREFVTEDPATRTSIMEAVKYAASDLPILILGPSGTGKTCLGRIIHEHSLRGGEFVAINCSAYTEDLLEVELFGCKKGAFTGASEPRKGKLLQAHHGTLFLDEIGAMSLNMQTKLLKAVEERSFYPVGSDKPERSEFRLVSATLEDLQRLIAQGKMRFDFFQRIHGLTVTLKPLAERPSDILPLLQFFTRAGKRLSFSAEAKSCVLGHSWPGNTRELKRFVELLAAGTDGRVTKEAAQRHLAQAGGGPGGPLDSFVGERQYRYAMDKGLAQAVDLFVGEIIRRNLAENGGKKANTLSDLRISTRLLYSTLKKSEPSDG